MIEAGIPVRFEGDIRSANLLRGERADGSSVYLVEDHDSGSRPKAYWQFTAFAKAISKARELCVYEEPEDHGDDC